jgi:AcrR family transcriptional regulator
MAEAVKTGKRTRRADKTQATRQRIIDAATGLFVERGYTATTIEAIADAADVAVETVYARFTSKTNLLIAVKDAAVTEDGQAPLNDQHPVLAALAAEPDQHRQVEIAVAHSCRTLARVAPVYSLLREAAGADLTLRAYLADETHRRRQFQQDMVALVRSRGPLRPGLSADQAAETYSALASPDLYLLVTTYHGWTADQHQTWLTDCLARLLLPDTGHTNSRKNPNSHDDR